MSFPEMPVLPVSCALFWAMQDSIGQQYILTHCTILIVAELYTFHVGIAFSHELGHKTTVMNYDLGKNLGYYFS